MAIRIIPSAASQIKWIDTTVPNIYLNKQELTFGFIPQQRDAKDRLASDMQGRVSTISLVDGKRIATLITNQFGVPVKVVKSLTIPYTDRRKYFDLDPATNIITLKSPFKEEDVYCTDQLQMEDLNHVREIVQLAQEQGLLSVDDRADLNDYLVQIEKAIAFSKLITDTITSGQKDTIEIFATPYIDAIIEACKNVNAPIDFLGGDNVEWQKLGKTFETLSKRDLALCLLFSSVQNHLGTVYAELACALDEECSESAQALQWLYNGDATLESTLWRSGGNIPNLLQQRLALMQIIESRLDEAFGKETAELSYEDSLLKALRTRLFAEGYHLDAIKQYYPIEPEQPNAEEDSFVTVEFSPFGATLAALKGIFCPPGEEGSTLHIWERNGSVLNYAERKEAFNAVKATVENELAFDQLPNYEASTAVFDREEREKFNRMAFAELPKYV